MVQIRAREDIYPVVETVGIWEAQRDFQREWEGWKAGFWLSMLSTLCHFHGLSKRARQLKDFASGGRRDFE